MTAAAVILRSGIASGKRVSVHIIVSKYSFPDLVRSNGPTQSRMTRSNGSDVTGIGCSGAGGIS